MVSMMLCAILTTSSLPSNLSFIRASNRVGDPHFYDAEGRVRIFHGANRVQKGFPWYFEDMLANDGEAELMEELGFNVLRLGWMWTGCVACAVLPAGCRLAARAPDCSCRCSCCARGIGTTAQDRDSSTSRMRTHRRPSSRNLRHGASTCCSTCTRTCFPPTSACTTARRSGS